jgi:transcriptional regulator with XRE-family HTH domain
MRLRRELLGIKPQEMVDRLRDKGLFMDRSTYVNIELGRRKSMSVPELLAIAYVLDMPPALLMIPVGLSPTLEVIKGEHVSSWEAFEWLRGNRPFPAQHGASVGEGSPGLSDLLSQSKVIQWHRFNDELQVAIASLESQPERSRDEIASKVEQLRHWRDLIREAGLVPPPLTPDIAATHPDLD